MCWEFLLYRFIGTARISHVRLFTRNDIQVPDASLVKIPVFDDMITGARLTFSILFQRNPLSEDFLCRYSFFRNIRSPMRKNISPYRWISWGLCWKYAYLPPEIHFRTKHAQSRWLTAPRKAKRNAPVDLSAWCKNGSLFTLGRWVNTLGQVSEHTICIFSLKIANIN